MDTTEALEEADACPDAAAASGLDFFVVGIGASAGGLRSIRTLLEGLPSHPGMAFVVMHFSPDHESSAAAVFQPSTRMPVTQVSGRVGIERDHVDVMPPGREPTMVDGALDVAASDSGRGIAPELLPHVFQMFTQADSSTRRGEGGLGIGPAMVRSLAELHGGRAEVESPGQGHGATFRVVLPLHQSSDFAALALDGDGVAADAAALAGLRVLLVDDTEDSLETFGYLLEHAGCAVTGAASARHALELAGHADFDLLISDVGMPQMDGYELVRELRRRPRTAALPAIALTGHGRSEDVREAFAAGFQAHVDKPVDIELMKAVVATVVGALRAARR